MTTEKIITSRYIIPGNKKNSIENNEEIIIYDLIFDIVLQNKEFIIFLNNLPKLKKNSQQFLFIDYKTHKQHPDELILDSINNILHALWLRSFQDFNTLVQYIDENGLEHKKYAGKIYSSLNPVFCILPWNHIQYKPTGQSKLCCRHDIVKESILHKNNSEISIIKFVPEREKQLSIQHSTIEKTFSSNYWKKAREYTITNQPIPGCHKCYKEESQDDIPISMRLGANILYNQGYLHKRIEFEQPKLEYLEIGFGNYCNLACLTCNSNLSTTWHDDEKALNDLVDNLNLKRQIYHKLDNINFKLSSDTLSTLKTIKFTGGEPMINPEFIKFIDHVCEDGHPENVSLEIYTNCSYVPSSKLLSNLKRFKEIQLNLSVDALGKLNDYVRYGSRWDGDQKQTVSNAIDFWLALGKGNKNIHVILCVTLSVLNILNIPKLMEWWVTKFKESGNTVIIYRDTALPSEHEGFFKIQPVFDPDYLSLNILPSSYYYEILNWIQDYRHRFVTDHPELKGIPQCINFSLTKLEQLTRKCKGNTNLAKNFKEYINAMDKIRNVSISNYIPEIENKINNYLINSASSG